MPLTLPIIILAAGRSSRMRGQDKLLEDVDGKPLLRRQAEMARAVTQGAVIVTLPLGPHPRYDVLAGLDVTPLPVADADEGMNASLRAGIAALPRDAACVMVLLADLPDLTENDLRVVAQSVDIAENNKIWRGATSDDKPGHPIVFHADVFTELTALTGDTGGREVAQKYRAKTVLIALPGNAARADLDTPEQWAQWRKARQRD